MADPTVKFEYSPAESMGESFASSPDAHYPSLFSTAMTPPFDDDSMFDNESLSGSVAGTPAPEKKQVKKRKSWGQQLPEPKTNLPPRKRAKTEDEKEQRRVERVLRNRRAAQSSRERKRQEVEALESQKQSIERRNRDLEMRLADAEAKNLLLQQQIAKMTGNMTVFNQTSPVSDVDSFRQATPLTFSQELFSSHDASPPRISQIEEQVNLVAPTTRTVNPASLSPEIKPVEESSNASSFDMTQHPAAMLCDLQCQSNEQRPWTTSTTRDSSISALLFWITLISATTSNILSPLWTIMHSLRMGSCLSPTPSILSTLIWLVTTPACLTPTTSTTTATSESTSTSTTSSTARPSTARTSTRISLRVQLLKRLLACSPSLARPLMDATMGAMRSASDHQLCSLTGLDGSVPAHGRGKEGPTIECLMTLLWVTHLFEREQPSSIEVATVPGARRVGTWDLATDAEMEALGQASIVEHPSTREVGKKSLVGGWSLASHDR